MPDYEVDGTIFTFDESWAVEKVDEWESYKNLTGMNHLGAHACDLVAVSTSGDVWFIEVKDYTYRDAKPPADLSEVVARKMYGTCALMMLVANKGERDACREFSRSVLSARRLSMCLHIELKDRGRKLEEVGISLISMQKKLRKQLAPFGLPKEQRVVTNSLLLRHDPSKAPWSSHRDPGARLRHSDRR